MKSTTRRRGMYFAFILALFLPTGCTPTNQGGEALPSTPAGEALVDSLASGDTIASGEIPTGEPTGEDPGAVEAEAALPGALRDSTPTPVQERLDRLAAVNDSLRAAVGTLLNVLASGGAARLQASTDSALADSSRVTSVTGQVRLTVDARRVGNWGVRIAVSIIFILLAGAFIRVIVWVLDKLAERNARSRLFFKRLVPIARISLWFAAILFCALVILNIQAQGLLAAGAAVGVAIGFAAQDIIKNIFGGIIVLFDQPFQVGDKISVGGTYGEVVSIGLRSTRITTGDDNLVSVPNSQVVAGQVANANAGELNCQVVTDLYLPGWVNEAQAKRIAFEAATSSKYVYLNKPIVVLVKDEFNETFLTHLKVKAYVLDPRYEFLLMSDVTERARDGFRKAGLIGPMHGVRAYVDLDRYPPAEDSRGTGREEEG